MRLPLAALGRRLLSASAARTLLGVPVGASKAIIKDAYYAKAKATHPDAVAATAEEAGSSAHDAFLAVQAAFEELMAEQAAPSSAACSTTSASSAARGTAGGPVRSRRRGPVAAAAARPPTLGEVLCGRLDDEPAAFHAVWDDIKLRRLEVTSSMTNHLFKACAATGEGMPVALTMLREATALGMLTQTVRSSSLVSLLTWCKEENLDATFAVVDEITDADKEDPEVFAALSATFSFFPSGASF